MDETYIKVKGSWKYLYRAVDKSGKTIDFLLTAKRDKAVIDEINATRETLFIVRQVKYLNNIVEQDHRAVKRVTKPMLKFKSFIAAKKVLAGIELMHMIRKGQLMHMIRKGQLMLNGTKDLSFAQQFYTLARQIRFV